jgi:DNA-binding transcriptional ArsR family regulator
MLKYLEIDDVFQALAVTARRAMVERLSRGPATVSDLARPFDMTLAAVVQHLKVLEAVGIIRSEKVGRVRTCTIAPGGLDPITDWVAQRRTVVEHRLDRLASILDEDDAQAAVQAHSKKDPQP